MATSTYIHERQKTVDAVFQSGLSTKRREEET
jgi:hypothetical protein